jgi:hypothetical protein
VKFNWYGELSALNFDIFYQKALVFIEDFRYWVHYMSLDNEVNTPNVDNKEGGLIKLFCQQFPNDYARHFVSALRDKRFESLDEFFVVFKARLKTSRDIFKVSSDELCRFDMGHEEKKMKFIEENSFGPNYSFTSKDASVSNAVGNTAASLDALDLSELQGKEQTAVIEDISEVVKPSTNDIKELIFQPSRPLSRAPPSPPNQTGCYKMVLEGRCGRKQCSYSHDPKALREKWRELRDQLDESEYKAPALRPESSFFPKPPPKPPENAYFAKPPPKPPESRLNYVET